MVSPLLTSSKSWEHDDRPVMASRTTSDSRRDTRGKVPGDGSSTSTTTGTYNHRGASLCTFANAACDRSVVSDSHHHHQHRHHHHHQQSHEALPMDEVATDDTNGVEPVWLTATNRHGSIGSSSSSSIRPPVLRIGLEPQFRNSSSSASAAAAASAAIRGSARQRLSVCASASASVGGAGASTALDDDVSSLGGVEDQNSSLQRITAAVKSRSTRPSGLSIEEKTLWDAVQIAVKQARVESYTGQQLTTTSGGDGGSTRSTDAKAYLQHSSSEQAWKETCQELQEQAKIQQKEHDRSMRAIQRVLADVTSQRDEAFEQLDAAPKGAMVSETASFERELQAKISRIVSLERELKVNKTMQRGGADVRQQELDLEMARQKLDQMERQEQAVAAEMEAKNKLISKLKRHVHGQNPNGDNDSGGSDMDDVSFRDWSIVRDELEEKKCALENAKMIITSLENASGSLASDMRSKLRTKEDEVAVLKLDLADRKKNMDTLATELRDLQRDQGDREHNESHSRAEEEAKTLQLMSKLESNLSELRSASVIMEATNDASAVAACSKVLSDTIAALKASIDTTEVSASSRDKQYEAGGSDLRRELREKKHALKRLEGNFRRLKDEAVKFQVENSRLQAQRDTEVGHLQNEIGRLREQCNMNMDVLTKKERELGVLRDSLKVEDDVGYISDDGSDGSDTDPTAASLPSQFLSDTYDPYQMEALATLRAQGRSGSFDLCNAYGSPTTVDALKKDLAEAKVVRERAVKELKSEKESLAKAKMIISALEKSNKSMMEDLRMRLQDSNTAITSLLAKSMDSEKSTSTLRSQLKLLKEESALEQAKLRQRIDALQRSGSPSALSVEEKKDDVSVHMDVLSDSRVL